MEGMKGWAWLLAAAAMACVPSAHAQQVSFQTLPVLQISTPIPGSTHAPQDLNGDGLSDMLWFNTTSSEMEYFLLKHAAGPDIIVSSTRRFSITPGYFIGAEGDTNGDGYADLVWTSAQHDLYFWINAKNGGFRSVYYGTYPSGWQLFGAGDVNGDGKDDLLWLNPTSCQLAYWLMDGTRRIGYRIIPYTCGYYPVAIGYFTPSNRISILWTSYRQDYWFWDSMGSGFASASIGILHAFDSPITLDIGGGSRGNGVRMSFADSASTLSDKYYLDRMFDASGRQTSYSIHLYSTGGTSPTVGTAGFVVEAGGVDQTNAIKMDTRNYWLSIQRPEPASAPYEYEGGLTYYLNHWLPGDIADWSPVGGMVNRVPPLVGP